MEFTRRFCRGARPYVAIALSGVFFFMAADERTDAHKPVTSKYDYNKDIFPLLRDHCGLCHVQGGPAPMSLMTYSDAVPWAESIRDELTAGRMPPWPVDPTSPPVKGGYPISSRDVDMIVVWASGGTPQGDLDTKAPGGNLQSSVEAGAARSQDSDGRRAYGGFGHDRGNLRVFVAGQRDRHKMDQGGRLDARKRLNRARRRHQHRERSRFGAMGARSRNHRRATRYGLSAGPQARRSTCRFTTRSTSTRSRTRSPTRARSACTSPTRLRPFASCNRSRSNRRKPGDPTGPLGFAGTLPGAASIVALRPMLDRAYESLDVDAITPSGTHVPLLRLRGPRPQWFERYWLQKSVELPAAAKSRCASRHYRTIQKSPR